MDNNVKIALVQFQSKLNCPDENMEKACGMIAQAACAFLCQQQRAADSIYD